MLLALLATNRVAASRLHAAATALGTALLRAPFTAAEAIASAPLARSGRAQAAPVFIVGHWRSGTTHLANLLSRSEVFGILSPLSVGLPGEALGLARVARPFVEQFFPRTRLIDEMALGPDLPQEDELALANLSLLSMNHGLYFPRRLRREFDRGVFGLGVSEREWRRWSATLRAYVAKMTFAHGGRRLLIRNPVDSARIPRLRAIWPQARFIHIHRHPAEVVASSRRMFRTLVDELALGPVACDIEGLVRHVYPRLMARIAADGAALPPGHFVEVSHAALVRDPLGEAARIHAALELPGFETARPRMEGYLAAVAHHAPRHGPAQRGAEAWLGEHAALLARWGYA